MTMALLLAALLPACGRGDDPSVAEEAAAAAARGVDQAKQERTLGRLEALRGALERYRIDHGSYPAGGSLDAIGPALSPLYLPRLESLDAWGNPMSYAATDDSYTVISAGDDGRAGTPDDLVMRDGAISGGR